MITGRNFLFTSSDTFAVWCIVQPQNSEKPNRRNFRVWNIHGQRDRVVMAIPDAAFRQLHHTSYEVRSAVLATANTSCLDLWSKLVTEDDQSGSHSALDGRLKTDEESGVYQLNTANQKITDPDLAALKVKVETSTVRVVDLPSINQSISQSISLTWPKQQTATSKATK